MQPNKVQLEVQPIISLQDWFSDFFFFISRGHFYLSLKMASSKDILLSTSIRGKACQLSLKDELSHLPASNAWIDFYANDIKLYFSVFT